MNDDHPLYPRACDRLASDLHAVRGTDRSLIIAVGDLSIWVYDRCERGTILMIPGPEELGTGRQLRPRDEDWLTRRGAIPPHGHAEGWYWEYFTEVEMYLVVEWALEALVDVYHLPEDVVFRDLFAHQS